MWGLLRKDWYVMRAVIIFYALMWMACSAMYAWIPEAERSHLYSIVPILMTNVVITAIDADKRCRWDMFAGMLPLHPRQIVLAKYLLAYGIVAVMIILGALAGWVSTLGKGGTSMWQAAAVMLTLHALWTPLRYRFDRAKGTLILGAVLGGFAALMLNPWGLEIADFLFDWIDTASKTALALGGAAVLIGANLISFWFSVGAYTRRQRRGEN